MSHWKQKFSQAEGGGCKTERKKLKDLSRELTNTTKSTFCNTQVDSYLILSWFLQDGSWS